MVDAGGAAEPNIIANTTAEDCEQRGQHDDYPADYEQRDDYYDFVAWDHATNSADTTWNNVTDTLNKPSAQTKN